jgi:hypothetical protein
MAELGDVAAESTGVGLTGAGAHPVVPAGIAAATAAAGASVALAGGGAAVFRQFDLSHNAEG